MKVKKIYNNMGKLVGIIYKNKDELIIEIVKRNCKTVIVIQHGTLLNINSFLI